MGNSGFSKEEAAELNDKFGLNRRAIEKTAKQWSEATNGTMTMTLPEFVRWCKSLNHQASLEKDERFERLFKLIDRDASGTVSFREILLVEGMHNLSPKERLRFVFELYDEDKDGKLTENDILIMAKDLFKSYPELRYQGILPTYDDPQSLTKAVMRCFEGTEITADTLTYLYEYKHESFRDKVKYPDFPSKNAQILWGDVEFWEYSGLHHLFLTDAGGRINIKGPDAASRPSLFL